MKKLKGWQRSLLVAAIIWILGCTIVQCGHRIDEVNSWSQLKYDSCVSSQQVAPQIKRDCIQEMGKARVEAWTWQPSIWAILGYSCAALLVPLVLWCMLYGAVRVACWIYRGFKPSTGSLNYRKLTSLATITAIILGFAAHEFLRMQSAAETSRISSALGACKLEMDKSKIEEGKVNFTLDCMKSKGFVKSTTESCYNTYGTAELDYTTQLEKCYQTK